MAMANMHLIDIFVTACTSVVVRRRRRRRRRWWHNEKHNTPKMFKFRGYNHNAILQTGIQVPTAIYILHLKIIIPYPSNTPHNLISYILHPQITSLIFYTPMMNLPPPTLFSHLPPPTFFYPNLPQFFTPTLPPPTSCVTPHTSMGLHLKNTL